MKVQSLSHRLCISVMSQSLTPEEKPYFVVVIFKFSHKQDKSCIPTSKSLQSLLLMVLNHSQKHKLKKMKLST